jgi:autotransporter-associated beta strand protein
MVRGSVVELEWEMRSLTVRCLLASVAAASLVTGFAHGAEKKWDAGGTAGAWASQNNWTSNTFPGSGDTITLDNSLATLPTSMTTQALSWTVQSITLDVTNSSTYTLGNNGNGGSNASNIQLAGDTNGLLLSLTNNFSGTFNIQPRNGSNNRDLTLTFSNSGTINVSNSAANLNISSNLTETGGARSITKTGNGILTLSGDNAWTGGTRINAGTIVVGSATGFGTGSLVVAGGTLNVGALTASVSSLTLNGGTVIGSTGSIGLTGNVLSTGASAITSRISLGATRTFDVTNTLTASGIISGSTFGITKQGAGNLVLGGLNSYTGLTDVQNGQVTVNNTGTIVGSVRVASGATFDVSGFGATGFSVATGQTLSGSGTVNGKVKIGGTNTKVSPGDTGSAPAALATGAEEWASGGTYVWDIKDANGAAGDGYDQLQLAGALSVTATTGSKFNIDITSLTAANANGNAANFVKTENYDWIIATTTGAVSINPGVFNFVDHFTNDTTSTGVGGAVDGAFSISGSGNNVVLHYSAAPEPGAITLLAIGIGGYLARRPARRQTR